jgi:hypothetical protein
VILILLKNGCQHPSHQVFLHKLQGEEGMDLYFSVNNRVKQINQYCISLQTTGEEGMTLYFSANSRVKKV